VRPTPISTGLIVNHMGVWTAPRWMTWNGNEPSCIASWRRPGGFPDGCVSLRRPGLANFVVLIASARSTFLSVPSFSLRWRANVDTPVDAATRGARRIGHAQR
jgi:hypothetical protein